MENSSFDNSAHDLTGEAMPMAANGSTCDGFRVRLYGKMYFMKRLKPAFASDPLYRAILQKEFETGFTLEHPGLVRYVSRGEDYIIMEYVEGETLEAFLASHPGYFQKMENADRFLQQLLDVVGYLHAHQVLHIDLKPQNILLTDIGHDVRIIDFGFCYTDGFSDTTGRTDFYAAPEQKEEDGKADERTDIYAIGKILQQLPCASRYGKIAKRCTAEEKALRYQTVDELKAAAFRKAHWHKAAYAIAAALLVVTAFLITCPKENRQEEEPSQTIPEKVPDQAKTDEQGAAAMPSVPVKDSARTQLLQTPAVSSFPKMTKARHKELRKELRELVRPSFDELLGAYNDSAVLTSASMERYSRTAVEWENGLMPVFNELWHGKYKGLRIFSEDDFFHECEQTKDYGNDIPDYPEKCESFK